MVPQKEPPVSVANSREAPHAHSPADFIDNDSDAESDDGRVFQCMTGMKEDIAARAPLYRDDWGKPQNIFTVVNATVFAFVIQLIPAIIFAEIMLSETQGNLGTAEVLLSSAIMGIIYATMAGQPIVIMGITGPVAVLLGTSFTLTEQFNAEYFPFFFWICIWAGLMHMISAMVGLVNLVWKVTPFTTQIFELFIAVTFIYLSLRALFEPLYLGQSNVEDRNLAYANFFIGVVAFGLAWSLHFADTWIFFTRQVRVVLCSYNTLIAVVIGTAFSYLPGIDQGDLPRVSVIAPWDWQPTADRPWVVSPLEGIDVAGVFGAMIPGLMFFLLFIIDHNVSSILAQSPKFNLKKPPAYHLDFFVVGLTFLPCAIMGLPPGNGLIPQAPLHVRALCTRKYVTDKHGVRREVVTHCEEQRWSGLGQSCLMFVALALFEVISWIPRGCLFGLLLYLGVGAMHGNEIWERFVMSFIIVKKRPQIPVVREVKWRTVQWYTLIQAAFAFLIWAIAQFTDFGYIYPVLLAALVPFRSYIVWKIFDEKDLKYLDPFGDDHDDEEYLEEQRQLHEAERRGSYDEEELTFPNRAEFRGQGRFEAVHHRHPPIAEVSEEVEVTDEALAHYRMQNPAVKANIDTKRNRH